MIGFVLTFFLILGIGFISSFLAHTLIYDTENPRRERRALRLVVGATVIFFAFLIILGILANFVWDLGDRQDFDRYEYTFIFTVYIWYIAVSNGGVDSPRMEFSERIQTYLRFLSDFMVLAYVVITIVLLRDLHDNTDKTLEFTEMIVLVILMAVMTLHLVIRKTQGITEGSRRRDKRQTATETLNLATFCIVALGWSLCLTFYLYIINPSDFSMPVLVVVYLLSILFLLAFVGFLAHGLHIERPVGEEQIRGIVHRAGIPVVISAWVISTVLYLDLLSPTGSGTDVMLNGNLPFVELDRNPVFDFMAFIIMLLYPVAYLIGYAIDRRYAAIPERVIRNPIDLERGKSVIVLADTHLGLRPNNIQKAFGRGSEWEPEIISSFIRWLTELPNMSATERRIRYWREPDGGRHEDFFGRVVLPEKEIKPPEYLVLLGDIVEMWDGTEESIQLATSIFLPRLNHVDAKLVYVVGNHDHPYNLEETPRKEVAIAEGRGEMVIVSELWPGVHIKEETDPDDITPLRAGSREYVFIHGHQFDWGFQVLGSLAFIPGHLRRAARTGHYAWIFLLMVVTTVVFYNSIGGPGGLMMLVVVLLLLLAIPIVYMTIGRWIWNSISSVRYKHESIEDPFRYWWKVRAGDGRYKDQTSEDRGDMTVVYGHTHITNITNVSSGFEPRNGEEVERYSRDQRLLNLPSWIYDIKYPEERAIFLYIDEGGYLFLGWDWDKKRPFHIPDALIPYRRDIGNLKADLAERNMDLDTDFDMGTEEIEATQHITGITPQDLDDLGWPESFQRKWFYQYTPPMEEDDGGDEEEGDEGNDESVEMTT